MLRVIALIFVGALCGAGATRWWISDAPELPSFRPDSPVPFEAEPRTQSEPANVGAAQDNLDGALAEALRLTDANMQRRELERIAALWAAHDPARAVSLAAQLPGRSRMAFRSALHREWAHIDAAGYLAHLEANPADLESLLGIDVWVWALNGPAPSGEGLRVLLASDPLGVVHLADKLSSTLGLSLKRLALSTYAESDPLAAIALLAEMPRGNYRDEALASVAAGYARSDPEGALVWVQSLSPQPPNVLSNVLQGLARHDIGRAVELALRPPSRNANALTAANAVIAVAAADPAQAAVAAERLLAIDVPRRDNTLSQLLSLWAARDVESLLTWSQAYGAALPDNALAATATALASRDPAAATRYTDRIPIAQRAAWIARVAHFYAASDSTAALGWLSRYEGQQGYSQGMRLALAQMASADPAGAAKVLDAAGSDVQVESAGAIADLWAQQDPLAAAQWARRSSDPRVRMAAVPEAVGRWSTQSAQAAEDWTLGLPSSPERDRALYVLLRGRSLSPLPREAYSTHPNEVLMSRIGNPAVREEAAAWFDK
jgi:hypothetical protein